MKKLDFTAKDKLVCNSSVLTDNSCDEMQNDNFSTKDEVDLESDDDNDDDARDNVGNLFTVSTCYQFKPDYPNHTTHAVFPLKDGKEFILNYISSILPR